MIKAMLTAAAALTLVACATAPTKEEQAAEPSTYTTGSNIARRDKGSVQNTGRYKKDPVTEAMGEDYGKGESIK